MTALLLEMQARQVFDAADRHEFTDLRGRQTYGAAGAIAGEPVDFLVPYLHKGVPWITAGFVDGVKIEGSDAALPDVPHGAPLYVVCRVVQEVLKHGGPVTWVTYLSGRYTIEYARLSTIAVDEFETTVTDDSGDPTGGYNTWTTSQGIGPVTDADGNPITQDNGQPHFHIDPNSLTF